MSAFLLGLFLIFSTVTHADDTTKVTHWTKKTLLNTLAIRYNDTSTDNEQHSIGLTPAAWSSVAAFIENYLPQMRDKQLTLHPAFLIGPKIVDSGTAANIPFWRINAEIILPEINKKVFFSLIVLATKSSPKDPYLVHSITLNPQVNP
ncbi:MAG: hypothetical protein QM652_04025 [Legionella sp.]|uniref:hypothetical protein n=1 Tax=Legionella sp. TaxID=459 RepID=UPI0039E620F8